QVKETLSVLSAIVAGLTAIVVLFTLLRSVYGLQQESRTYAQNISRRDTASDIKVRIGPLEFRSSRAETPSKTDENEVLPAPEAEPQPIDTSNPNAIFKVSRQRLLDEAVRIDAISRRNLGIGILFSSIALAVLAWPLVAAVFFPEPTPAELNSWG